MPLPPWEWPETPWNRLHVDYAGPFLGKMFLIVVDAHSKWIDAYPTAQQQAKRRLKSSDSALARTGCPRQLYLITERASQFETFETFLKQNGIQHVASAPFHPFLVRRFFYLSGTNAPIFHQSMRMLWMQWNICIAAATFKNDRDEFCPFCLHAVCSQTKTNSIPLLANLDPTPYPVPCKPAPLKQSEILLFD